MASQPPNIDLDALLGELEAPEIDADLATLQTEQVGAACWVEEGQDLPACLPGCVTTLLSRWLGCPGLCCLRRVDCMLSCKHLTTRSLRCFSPAQGAVFDDAGVVVHYKNDSRAMHALEHTGGCCCVRLIVKHAFTG